MNIWIEKNFTATGILIVLESTYEDDDPLETYVARWIDGTLKKPDWTITRMFNDCAAQGQSKEDFWDSVGYYDFVPGSVGPTNQYKANHKHFAKGAAAFPNVLARVQPKGVLLVGKGHQDFSMPIVARANIPFRVVNHPRSGVSDMEMRGVWNALRRTIGLRTV